MWKKKKKKSSTADSVEEAIDLIKAGKAPDGLAVKGTLRLKESKSSLRLPAGLSCYQLDLEKSAITSLPEGLTVQFRLILRNCSHLVSLPRGIKAGSIDLGGCVSLVGLPEDFDTYFLDISGCPQLKTWPEYATLHIGRLSARNCVGLKSLPTWITHLAQLDLRGCKGISTLPEGLRIDSWLDLAETQITSLPDSLKDVPLRWKGVPVDRRIAFRPESITADEVLGERNAERRRVLLERMGFEQFLSQADAEVVDQDRDVGGERRLLRVKLVGDEDLVCVAVYCPSTSRQYLIRVPPSMKTCHQAIAWTAGFDDPSLYKPLIET